MLQAGMSYYNVHPRGLSSNPYKTRRRRRVLSVQYPTLQDRNKYRPRIFLRDMYLGMHVDHGDAYVVLMEVVLPQSK
jgi:hypothetical protein